MEKVHNRAKDAVGKTLYELNDYKSVEGTKNSVGDLFEKWFGKSKDSSSKPDMEEAEVELKATPFKKLKNGKLSAKERLVLNIINYNSIVNETFLDSHFLYKNGKIEIAFYEYLDNVPKDEWTIQEAVFYEMSKNPVDFEIIRNDWEKITQYVKDGKAHELSESLTNYLAPCTKGASSRSVRTQPFSSVPAKQRAYSLKAGYMTSILRKHVFGDEVSESIIKDRFELKVKSIEEIVLERFAPYKGWTIEKLKRYFKIDNDSYQLNYQIAACILNLNGKFGGSDAFSKVEEFEKASILVKTVKFNENNYNKESMSFPSFKFKELSEETWVSEDGEPSAEWHNFLLDTRFLFFVVKTENGQDVFKGIKFFTIPDEDLQGPIRAVWEDTVHKLNSGVELKAVKRGDGIRINNNFISKSDDMICHIRPHERCSDYTENGKYADKLPVKAAWINKPEGSKYSEQWMTKQCFWLNNNYIKEQVKDIL
ncbi:Sau3AI family type II restriction endonuclease [Marinilactibacillus psychrotolerans]|uniref:Sau3AI family type II restriction endonuclease n=1 Tax=Marinilactibacillus psychrotolerans TaxID=191770 RepID=UPI0038876AAB